jgi:N-methylhydantoinase A
VSGWRVGVDVGGTFTDIALLEEGSGRLKVRKVPTTSEDPVEGVLAGVEASLGEAGVEPASVVYFGAGTTLALNTVIQRAGGRTGLLVTEGYRDVLEIRRTRLPDAPSYDAARPVPLVRRAHVREVAERTMADGSILRPLEPASVREAARALADAGVEAIAICFLHSYANPEHERLAREIVSAEWPDLFLCTSVDTWPQQREYERALVAVMNAYTGPAMSRYYGRLETGLRRLGIGCPLLVTQSNGGTMSVADAARVPVRTMLSGPASGVMAAVKEAREEGMNRFFTLDMGGTSADMAVVDEAPRFGTESVIGDFPLFMPAIAINTLGAGGGSIAWLDDQAVLKVGPRSAGAHPGPACYGRGGEEPTVTDAYLVSGILGPRDLLGGEMELSSRLAEEAVGALGGRMGLDAARTAEAILRIATANMYAEFLPMIARYGVDQREFVLVPYGGAGPTHAFFLAEEAGLTRLLIPRTPGAMCALGAALTDLQMDFVRSVRERLSERRALEEIFADLEREAAGWLTGQGLSPESAVFERSADMRFVGQSFDLTVELDDGHDPAGGHDPGDAFRSRYEQVYGYQDPECPIEVLQLRLLAKVRNPPPIPAGGVLPDSKGPPRAAGERSVLYRGEWVAAKVYRREDLPPEVRLEGPAVVTQYDTTIFITPRFAFWADARGNIRAEVKS